MNKFVVTLDGVFNTEIEVEAETEEKAVIAAEKKLDESLLLDGEDFKVTGRIVCQKNS